MTNFRLPCSERPPLTEGVKTARDAYSPAWLSSPPPTQPAIPLASFSWPPLTELLGVMAWFRLPPLTEDSSPRARLPPPPLTELASPCSPVADSNHEAVWAFGRVAGSPRIAP